MNNIHTKDKINEFNENITTDIEYMETLFPQKKMELEYDTPFQLLLSVMFSAQTTDVQVNKVAKKLYSKVQTPEDLIHMGEDRLRENINTLGFYRTKAKHAFRTAEKLSEKTNDRKTTEQEIANISEPYKTLVQKVRSTFGYYIPHTVEQLTAFPGVGEKTAKVVLNELYDMPLIGVDTHVHRVANRLGWVQTKTALQTSSLLEKLIPQERMKKKAHYTIVLFGRYHCKAKKPACNLCLLSNHCNYYLSTLRK